MFQQLYQTQILSNNTSTLGHRTRLKAKATTEGIEMEEYEDDDSSDEEVDFEEATENAHVTFNLSKQKRQVS